MNPLVRPVRPGCRARSAVVRAAAFAAALSTGCKDSNTVTGLSSTPIPTTATAAPTLTATTTPSRTTLPTRAPTAPPPATPIPTPATISGNWTGTVHYLDLDYWWPHCTPEASATFSQGPPVYGSRITGVLHSSCFNATFEGTLQADGTLAGEVTLQRGLSGAASGSFSGNVLSLEVPVFPYADEVEIGGFSIQMQR